MLPQQRFCSYLNCFLVRTRTRAANVAHCTEGFAKTGLLRRKYAVMKGRPAPAADESATRGQSEVVGRGDGALAGQHARIRRRVQLRIMCYNYRPRDSHSLYLLVSYSTLAADVVQKKLACTGSAKGP